MYGVFLYEFYLDEAKKQGYCEALTSSPPVSCRILKWCHVIEVNLEYA